MADDSIQYGPAVQDPFANQKLEQGPPLPSQFQQFLGNAGQMASKIMMAFDPAQSIPYMLGQLPGPQRFLAQHPQGADILSAITSLGLAKMNPYVSASLGNEGEMPIQRYQREESQISPPRRGGNFFSPGQDETNPYDTNFTYPDNPKMPKSEGGSIPVSAIFRPNNPYVTSKTNVESALPEFVGEKAADKLNSLGSSAKVKYQESRLKSDDPYFKEIGKYGVNYKTALEALKPEGWLGGPSELVTKVLAQKAGHDSVISRSEIMASSPRYGAEQSPVTIKSIGKNEIPGDPEYINSLQQRLFKLDPGLARVFSKSMAKAGGIQQ